MNLRAFMLALALSMATPAVAHAGKSSIKTLDIASLDDVFSDAADIDSRLTSA